MRLEIDHVQAGYGDSIVMRDVSLIVPSGKAVALLGPNGAGKTTLLSVASGLVRARRGSVRIDGVDVSDEGPDARARRGVCHVTEGRSVFPGLTVVENLRLFSPKAAEGEAIERATSAFPRLAQRLKQVTGTMSGGEQQMVALARAYTTRAPLVLLDEVSLGLAPRLVDEIFEFLVRLTEEGTGLLIVEQYVAKALAIADQVYLLDRGRVVFAGEPGEVSDEELSSTYLASSSA